MSKKVGKNSILQAKFPLAKLAQAKFKLFNPHPLHKGSRELPFKGSAAGGGFPTRNAITMAMGMGKGLAKGRFNPWLGMPLSRLGAQVGHLRLPGGKGREGIRAIRSWQA